MGAKGFLPLDYLRFVENMAPKNHHTIAAATVYLDTQSPGILTLAWKIIAPTVPPPTSDAGKDKEA